MTHKLQKYACYPKHHTERDVSEQAIDPVDAFVVDRQRIIHSAAFRRLEYKTQVFINDVGDHYRTRLTHTLEVVQIARYIARKLSLNEDVAEIVALAHDLGHPPFGHAGERALDCAAGDYGGFNHNIQTLRVLTLLEKKFVAFDGLNLTKLSIDSIAKHNGPLAEGSQIASMALSLGINPQTQPCLEAQVAALADDIAYICHDIEDGIRAEMIDSIQLTTLPLLEDLFCSVANDIGLLDEKLVALKNIMINDLVHNTEAMINKLNISSPEEILIAPPIVSFSKHIDDAKESIKAFLMENVYRNYQVNRMMLKAQDVLLDIFQRYLQYPMCLPTGWQDKVIAAPSEDAKARIIIDYISGMTDRFAYDEHRKLFF
jgi:dGTPase